MQASKQITSDKVAVEKLRAVLAQLDETETGVLGELKNELRELLSRSSPRGRKRTPAPVNIDDFDLSRRGIDPDAALYCADLVGFLSCPSLDGRLQSVTLYSFVAPSSSSYSIRIHRQA